jgi:hypothetical protein
MQLISILLLVLLFLAFIIRRWNEPVKKEVFDRTPATLTYSKHARCRMQCRQIDENEVQEIMRRGIINFNRSNRRDRPCPTFALQGKTSSGEKLRVIFAQCPSETTVVTCYNLEEEFSCGCPGDEKKNKN